MNWKTVAIERLKDYNKRKASCETIPEQIKSLEMDYASLKGSVADETGIRSGNGKREDALIENIVKREELARNLDIAKKEIDITEKALATLTDEQIKILDKFYISKKKGDFGHVELLCEELFVERSRVYELKDEALREFTLACYGVVEP